MKNMTLFLTTMFLSLTVLVPKERNVENNDASTIMHNGNEYQMNRAIPQNINPSSRDIIYSDELNVFLIALEGSGSYPTRQDSYPSIGILSNKLQ